jgi:hypothetical protein
MIHNCAMSIIIIIKKQLCFICSLKFAVIVVYTKRQLMSHYTSLETRKDSTSINYFLIVWLLNVSKYFASNYTEYCLSLKEL